MLVIDNRAIQVVEFLNGGKKLERFLPKNQHTQRNFENFENWTNSDDRVDTGQKF